MLKTIEPKKMLRGIITLPGDKSISHRSAIFNAISKGYSKVTNFSQGEDASQL